MELKQLEHFLAVAEERHFTRAARRMNIVQSGLSTSIRALEQELKADLFLRTTRSVELTAAGKVLLDKAQRVVAAVREARDAVHAVQGLAHGSLSIGAGPSLGAYFDLPALLDRFHSRHPDIEIHLVQGGAASLLDRVRAGEVDLAFAALSEPAPGVATTMIAHEDLVLACAINHPLAGHKGLSLGMLAAESFIDFQPGWGIRTLVDRAFAGAGIKRHIAFEVADLSTLLDLVARGLGVALVPRRLAQARAATGEALRVGIAAITQPSIHWQLVLAFARLGRGSIAFRNPATQAFVELVEEMLAEAARPLAAGAKLP